MNQIEFIKSSIKEINPILEECLQSLTGGVVDDFKEINPILEEYLQSLTGVVDDFWEEHILMADIYFIKKEEKVVGCFSIHNKDKITMFYIQHEYIHMAQDIFKKILSDFCVQTAFVATCDLLFLNLCLDFHKKVELQAYFFDGTRIMAVREPEYGRELLSEIKPEEIDEINRRTDDFFSFASQENYYKIGYKIFRLAENGIDLGYGIYGPGRLIPRYFYCGMVTIPEHREKGIGRSIQIHMADMIRENGGVPVSGCWYYNTLSKKTIESAGRYNSVRLLNVFFVERLEK